jgi:hypothetical protein
MARALISFALIFCISSGHESPALAQAQPLIVDLTIAALRGFVGGVATKGGEAFYDSLTKTPDSGTRSPPPTSGPVQSPTSPGPVVASNPPPQVVPIEPPTPPDGIRWRLRNDYGTNIAMQFYSASRRARWPDGNRAYLLVTGQPATIRLRCIPGEKICYGGAVSGRYWGVGLGLRSSCTSCCRICGSDGRGIALR